MMREHPGPAIIDPNTLALIESDVDEILTRQTNSAIAGRWHTQAIDIDLLAEIERQTNEALDASIPVASEELLETLATELAERWRGLLATNAPRQVREFLYSRQAALFWAYNGKQEQDGDGQRSDYLRAQKYLAYLFAREAVSRACPLAGLTPGHIDLLVRLTIEEAIQFEAYLRYVSRSGPPSQRRWSDHRPDPDYLAAVAWWGDRLCTCPSGSVHTCVQQLRTLYDAARDRLVGTRDVLLMPEANKQEDRELLAQLRTENNGGVPAPIKAFATAFYTWFDATPDAVPEDVAAAILRSMYGRRYAVSVFEMLTKCFIASHHQTIHRTVREECGYGALPASPNA